MTIMGLAATVGCGGPAGPKTVPASGVVTYKTLPVAGASVAFLGDGKSAPAMAITDAKGEFILSTTTPGDGAVVGSHQVTVTKMMSSPTKKATGPTASSMETAAKNYQETKNQEPQKSLSMIPEQYSMAATSGLTFNVEAGKENNFKIELKD